MVLRIFWLKMVQQSLVDYIRNLLAQGYDAGTIRTTLLNAGYSPYDVDLAMRVSGGSVPRRVPVKALLLVFVGLVLLIGGVLLVLKLLQPAPAVLDLSLSLLSSRVAPGGALIVNAEVSNPSGRRVGAVLDVVVEGPGGRIAAKSEDVSVEGRVNVPIAVQVPVSAQVGMYEVRAVLAFTGGSVRRSVDFEVAEGVPETQMPSEAVREEVFEQAKEAQAACPAGCDDLNFCTSDSCVQGECVHAPIVPCCGNGVCEAGEVCPVDCAARPVDVDDVRERAKSLAVSNLDGAVSECNGLAQRAFIDACLGDVAEASGQKQPCYDIVAEDIRDACLMSFAYDDASVCSDIVNPYMRQSCVLMKDIRPI